MGETLPESDARPSEIEIRPVFETPNFGDAMTPEVAELEDRLAKAG